MIGPAWDDYGPMFDDRPTASELAADLDAEAEYYCDVERMLDHYADEIDGRIVPPVDDIPPATASLTNAPGQLRFSFGAAY
jgi:hypothetical protein